MRSSQSNSSRRVFSTSRSVLHRDKNGKLQAGVGRGVGLQFAQQYFPQASTTLRIASGYFRLNGFDLCRDLIKEEAHIQILVNQEEAKNVADTIYNEVHHQRRLLEELGTTTVPLHDAVVEIIKRIQGGRFLIKEARSTEHRYRFHCKFYISDELCMWSGSANFSKNGLHPSGNVEQVQACLDVEQIEVFKQFYDEALAEAHNLLEATRRCLEDWLKLTHPFTAYLRVLKALYSQDAPHLGRGGLHPSIFQEGVIARTVEQVRGHDGALLLVATGLGKTVIGAESARRLTAGFVNSRVIVLAPASVHDKWTAQLRSRNLAYRMFDVGLLFQKLTDKSEAQVNELAACLQECDERTILLVDEAHTYRKLLQKESVVQKKNEKLQEGEEKFVHLVRERMAGVVASHTKIILLTATPYGTDKQNLNSLLYLLPPPQPQFLRLLPQSKKDDDGGVHHWHIENVGGMADLPVVTVLGLTHVLSRACEDGDVDGNGRVFVTMPQHPKRRYFPKSIVITPVKYSLPLETDISNAFEANVFGAQPVPVDVYEESTGRNKSVVADVLRNTAIAAWLSSPEAMLECVQRCLSTVESNEILINDEQSTLTSVISLQDAGTDEVGSVPNEDSPRATNSMLLSYKAKFNLSLATRQVALAPLESKLRAAQRNENAKFGELLNIIREHALEKKEKVIIFLNRRPTVYAVAKTLASAIPSLRVKATVRKTGNSFTLYGPRTRKQIIKRFSPRSNKHNVSYENELDVLCCTDADGMGVDMQDACVVINYDIPSGADGIMQRAGRVLRMTEDPDRCVYLYNFVPELSDNETTVANDIRRIFDKLKERHDNARNIVGGSVWYENPVTIPLATCADVKNLTSMFPSPEEQLQSQPSPILRHIATLQKHKDEDDLHLGYFISAKEIAGSKNLLFLLIKYNNEDQAYPLVYNTAKQQIEDMLLHSALDLLQCSKTEEVPFNIADIGAIERQALDATNAWCAKYDKKVELCNRTCCIYLRGAEPEPKDKQSRTAPNA